MDKLSTQSHPIQPLVYVSGVWQNEKVAAPAYAKSCVALKSSEVN